MHNWRNLVPKTRTLLTIKATSVVACMAAHLVCAVRPRAELEGTLLCVERKVGDVQEANGLDPRRRDPQHVAAVVDDCERVVQVPEPGRLARLERPGRESVGLAAVARLRKRVSTLETVHLVLSVAWGRNN